MPMRALIVDDSQQVASTMEIALAHAGWETVCAGDVRGALAAIEEAMGGAGGFELIVTDLDMPREDGYSLIAAVRAHPLCSDAVIVVTSGSTAADAEQRARAAGANAYFVKPYSPAAVRQEIERLMNGREKVGS